MRVKSKTFARVLLLSAGMLSGCVTYIPVDEYTISRAAYEAARESEAARYAPALWFSAEKTYREAQQAYKERNYTKAKHKFEQAKDLAEQAENAARLARFQSGDTSPR